MAEGQIALQGHYDYRLVALSIFISILAAYAALDLAGRVTSARGRARFFWLSGGAVAMGTGIWSMHYIGMEALRLPVPVFYDWPTVLISMLAAIVASGIALFVVSRKTLGVTAVVIGSLTMGSGIAAMHYIGMEAMRLPAMCHYSLRLVSLSVVLAIVISGVALFLTFRFRGETDKLGLVERRQRFDDGGSYSGDALCRHGCSDFCPHAASGSRPAARRENLGPGHCRNNPGHAPDAWTGLRAVDR